ncbi:uncharacterized protein NP_2706A [Natronomonas pharaonis DSM 2160]|uniref:Uncharacterized protein n=1 Tax=Natronomonas pharaonis (strain ATCC 35678 / DSM 2160 / CIP 103997 / JCM 8858 / NBRC 14720 / NCIMB 2260 / Gabara) TaxID=348780 RepID=A0A1U7EWG9_NATPD|nr:hypothetical protein [Natronomonas pharaonis]CAI49444.1 uncharacterized protein NP_2706A [Natronomonas pharaonis DSM 2160]
MSIPYASPIAPIADSPDDPRPMTDGGDTKSYRPPSDAPLVPIADEPATPTTQPRADGGDRSKRFARPPETDHASGYDTGQETILPLVADMR